LEKILQKKNSKKYIFGKKFLKIFFSKNQFAKKKVFRKKFVPTLVEVSSSELKLEENETFLLQWVEMGLRGVG